MSSDKLTTLMLERTSRYSSWQYENRMRRQGLSTCVSLKKDDFTLESGDWEQGASVCCWATSYEAFKFHVMVRCGPLCHYAEIAANLSLGIAFQHVSAEWLCEWAYNMRLGESEGTSRRRLTQEQTHIDTKDLKGCVYKSTSKVVFYIFLTCSLFHLSFSTILSLELWQGGTNTAQPHYDL